MGETRGNRWTPKEDSLFRKMAEAKIGPEIIATKLNRSVHAKGWKWLGCLKILI
jgi:hypothetical protein